MAEGKLQIAKVRGKPEYYYRQPDPLRDVLRRIKKGDKDAAKKLLNPELRTLVQERVAADRVPKDRSPLLLASQYNRWDLLRCLHENFEVNFEQESTSTVITGGEFTEGATSLWVAATFGHMECVQYLVDSGANIEHTAESRSSPVQGAATNGHLNVVKFLADKGANIHGHHGYTPLHAAAQRGIEDVTKFLVKAGALNTANVAGYTPAILACAYGHHTIMDLLHARFPPSPKEQYDCYCLLVTNNVLDGRIGSAITWIIKAIDVRQKYPEINEELANFPAHPVYNGLQEPSREDVARHILGNDVLSFSLCSVYCERILGTVHQATAFYIRTCAEKALEDQRYEYCMELWHRSLEYKHARGMSPVLQTIEDLLFRVSVFTTMLNEEFVPAISRHFEWGMKQLKPAKALESGILDICHCLCRLLAVWFLVVDATSDTKAKQAEKEKLVSAARQLCVVLKGGKLPPLLACLSNPPDHTLQIVVAATMVATSKLPLHLVVEMFINLGCSMDCEDNMGNYPLHLAVMLSEDSSLKCVQLLVENGAHIDAVNHFKQTPLDLARTECGFFLLKDDLIHCLSTATRENFSLQCLAAKAVITHGLHYRTLLPPFLASFVAQHESVEQDDSEDEDSTEDDSTDQDDWEWEDCPGRTVSGTVSTCPND